MKKLFAILLALAMVLSLSVTALAADDPANSEGTGSITVTNSIVGKTYSLYKIFDAEYSAAGISYRISATDEYGNPNPVHNYMFGEDGETENPVFEHDHNNGNVTRKKDVFDNDITDYVTKMVKDTASFTGTPIATKTGTGTSLVFENIATGYYLITSTNGTLVTICSNDPTANVIDKNQTPTNFVKGIVTTAADGKEELVDFSTAAIGDKIPYKMSLIATNYNGEKKVHAYQFQDTMGDGLWIDFNSIKVKIGGIEYNQGWLLNQINAANGETRVYTEGPIGSWDGDRNDAKWYAVYEGGNKFRITIPWLADHQIEEDSSGEHKVYTLKTDETKTSLYDSTVNIEIYYDAYVGSNAIVGDNINNLTNTAKARWICAHDSAYSNEITVETETYGIGILKEDADDQTNLAGAKFRLYDDNGTAVQLVPTKIQGIYMVDSRCADVKNFSGLAKKSATDITADEVTAYEEADATRQLYNYGITPVNGKIVILGLDVGVYKLVEAEAPAGYNPVDGDVTLTVNAANSVNGMTIFADANGGVADITSETGAYSEHFYDVISVVVKNSKGAELPSTGGETAMKLITFGSILAIGFAILLITQKKMSVYKD